MRVACGIIGISGIDPGGILLDFDFSEVHAAHLHRQLKQSLTDCNAMVRLGTICETDSLFTRRQPPVGLFEVMNQADEACRVKQLVP